MKALCLFLVLAAAALPARAQDATETIQSLHAVLLETMKVGPYVGFDGRARLLAPALAAAYDFPGMTRRALGRAADGLGADQLERLSDAFTRYTVANYASQFRSWDGERFEIVGTAPSHGGGLLVPTRIVQANGEPARLTYVMREGEDGWQIADVLLDGTISQLAVRRAEFQTVLKREGSEGLVRLLEQRIAALASAPP